MAAEGDAKNAGKKSHLPSLYMDHGSGFIVLGQDKIEPIQS